MDDRRFVQFVFAISVVLVLLLSMLPALADVPEDVLVRPIAHCSGGKCWMAEKDYKQLQAFHQNRMVALMQAGNLIEELQGEVEALNRKLARFAMGCEKRTS